MLSHCYFFYPYQIPLYQALGSSQEILITKVRPFCHSALYSLHLKLPPKEVFLVGDRRIRCLFVRTKLWITLHKKKTLVSATFITPIYPKTCQFSSEIINMQFSNRKSHITIIPLLPVSSNRIKSLEWNFLLETIKTTG